MPQFKVKWKELLIQVPKKKLFGWSKNLESMATQLVNWNSINCYHHQ